MIRRAAWGAFLAITATFVVAGIIAGALNAAEAVADVLNRV